MPAAVLSPFDQTTLAAWRAGDDIDNPAGPLFVSGPSTEADLVESDFLVWSGYGCSACTASRGVWCC